MFSALKKFVTNEQVHGRPNVPSGVQAMGQSLQRKFAKGVQYNMKVIIKGDRNTGKTTLFHRLQGERFKEEYIPTQEIQVTCIQWNYKATDDIVKVEVWDVVDKGKPRKKSEGLKLENTKDEEPDQPCLDAEFLDVYKGTNGVVMLLDVTKQWTWLYVQRELPKVPNHIPVLVMANFKDMGEHRTVLDDEVRLYVETFERPTGSAHVQFAEASMKNGFGLKYLHTFFNVPFLQLQRETLLRQLETNQLELDATMEELDMRKESEDQNYLLYLESLEERRKQRKIRKSGGSADGPKAVLPNGQALQASSLTPTPTPSASGSNPGSSAPSPSRGSPAHTPNHNTPTGTPPSIRHSSPSMQPASIQPTVDSSPPSSSGEQPAAGEGVDAQGGSLTQRFSKWFSGGEGKVKQGMKEEASRESEPVGVEPAEEVQLQQELKITDVHDFVPEEGLDSKFLEEPESKMKKAKAFFSQKVSAKQEKPSRHSLDSDSDDNDGGNPMVAGFQEDLDSEDDNDVFPPPTENSLSTSTSKVVTSYDIELSSEEDESPVMAKDEDISDPDDVWKTSKSKSPNQVSGREDQPHFDGLLGSSGIGNSAIASKNAVTVSQKAPSTDSSSDDELPPGILEKNRTSSQTSDGDTATTTSPMSAGLQLQLEDLNFLESVGSSKPKMQKRASRTSDEFDVLVTIAQDEDVSDTDTMTSTSTSSSAKKKKHKNKEKHRDKDDDKSHKKHKHKKHKDKDRERDDGSKDKSDKKKKKHNKKGSEGENAVNTEMNELEAFLEGPASKYEAF